jgi:hypothetical protein
MILRHLQEEAEEVVVEIEENSAEEGAIADVAITTTEIETHMIM